MTIVRKNKRVAAFFVILVAAVCVWYTVHRARTQSRIVTELRHIGGRVYFVHHFVGPDQRYGPELSPSKAPWLRRTLGRFIILSDVVSVDLRMALVDEDLLKELCRLPKLELLQIGPRVTDEALRFIGQINQIDSLYLTGPVVTDDDLVHLSGLTRLVDLGLEETSVTGDGLKYLVKLPNLEHLDLSNSLADDSGMKSVGKLRHLEKLDLGGTRVTDRGLEELSNLSKLTIMFLLGTDATGEGIKRLSKDIPHCYMVTFEEWED